MSNGVNYDKVFNRVCHIVALKQDGKLQAAIDGIVLTAFAYDSTLAPKDAQELQNAIEVLFGVELKITDVQHAIDSNLERGHLQRQNGALFLLPATRAEHAQHIEAAVNLERTVKNEWLEQIADLVTPKSDNWENKLWKCLSTYMARTFHQHGVQTVQLLNPALPLDDEDTKSLQSYLNEAHRRHCGDMAFEVVAAAVQSFFTKTTNNRVAYVTQLLDGTFTYFALTVDEETARFLRENLKPLTIFVDTNFVFGLFNMHDNSLNEVSRELVETVKQNNLPFTFAYHPKTLEEIEKTLFNYGSRLRVRPSWSQRTSRIAINSQSLSGIERRYHQENLRNPVSPDTFLSRFDQIGTLLEDMGFALYSIENLGIDQQQGIDYAHDYDAYLKQRRGFSKGWDLITHDILLLQTVKAKRNSGRYGLEVGAFFITVDFHLANFERSRLRDNNHVSVTIMPNQLLQLLRPFISTASAVDEKFVETFAVPEFRVAYTDYSETTSKVLSLIDQYGVSEETGIRLLTNQMTIEQFHSLDENSQEFKDLFESELARENERLAELKKKLEGSLAQKEEENQRLHEQSETKDAQLQSTISAASQRTQALEHQIDKITAESDRRLSEAEKQRVDLEKRLEHEQIRNRMIIAFLLILVGTATVWIVPSLVNWQWLLSHPNQNSLKILYTFVVITFVLRVTLGSKWTWFAEHPRKIGLQLIAVVVLAGMVIALANPQNSEAWIIGATIAALGVLAQIVDRK